VVDKAPLAVESGQSHLYRCNRPQVGAGPIRNAAIRGALKAALCGLPTAMITASKLGIRREHLRGHMDANRTVWDIENHERT
jgi:hypothetical protein